MPYIGRISAIPIITFSTRKAFSRVSGRSMLLAPSRLSLITSHQQERRWKGGGGSAGSAHPRQRGEPEEGSILIKGFGAEPRLKIETEGDWHRFLPALTARLTAARRRRAVEPSRESARLPMMRWDGEITSDKPSTRNPPLITQSARTHTHKHAHTQRKSNYHMIARPHTHRHTLIGTHTLAAPWAGNGNLAGWASTCPLSSAKPQRICSHTYKIPLDVAPQPRATVHKGYRIKWSVNSVEYPRGAPNGDVVTFALLL